MIATPLPPDASPALFTFLVVGGIVTASAFINFVVSYGRGWRSLAADYRCEVAPREGVRFSVDEGSLFPWMNYEQGVDATLMPQGVYLTARFARRPFHPPLMLPWDHFESFTVESSGFTQVITSEFADPQGRRMRITLPKQAIPVIREMSGRNDIFGEVLR